MRSRVFTLWTKCSVLPPVSPSRMMGFVVTSMISSIVFTRLVKSTSSMSGLPLNEESHSDDTHMPSNDLTAPVSSSTTEALSTIRPERPLDASMTRRQGFSLRSLRSDPRRESGDP